MGNRYVSSLKILQHTNQHRLHGYIYVSASLHHLLLYSLQNLPIALPSPLAQLGKSPGMHYSLKMFFSISLRIITSDELVKKGPIDTFIEYLVIHDLDLSEYSRQPDPFHQILF